MECIETRALKSSFLLKTNPQMFQNDDVWCLTKISSVAADDFSVEDLLNLDLPEKEFQEGYISLSREDHQFREKELSNNSSSNFTGADEIDSLSGLALPVDDLEWLSQFVDDSTSGLSLLCPARNFKPGPNPTKRAQPAQQNRAPRFPLPIHGKARSSRSRKPSLRPWALSSLPLTTVDFSSSSHDQSNLSALVLPNFNTEKFSRPEKSRAKKQKRRAEPDCVSGRRCTHCEVQKTPQWRAGPLGPKTLCNACGVRYKSGRLFPEYRPAFSPTFSHELHSNSHRKVIEMRRNKKEMELV
ncbi:GATA transcription factor 5 [Striga asiatica]|uniref:GATA transcription factor n=1 Tax=Striga asiatica TaxID=4170 RepID=A0A5A7QY33_STRAF|nr:GATA transcription factor 5 [Striga asiatica]